MKEFLQEYMALPVKVHLTVVTIGTSYIALIALLATLIASYEEIVAVSSFLVIMTVVVVFVARTKQLIPNLILALFIILVTVIVYIQ